MENNNNCSYLLKQVNELGIAMYDTLLYLDTHPCDSEALNYYKYVCDMYSKAMKIYEDQCGPLNAQNGYTAERFEWVKGPWPWEGVC